MVDLPRWTKDEWEKLVEEVWASRIKSPGSELPGRLYDRIMEDCQRCVRQQRPIQVKMPSDLELEHDILLDDIFNIYDPICALHAESERLQKDMKILAKTTKRKEKQQMLQQLRKRYDALLEFAGRLPGTNE